MHITIMLLIVWGVCRDCVIFNKKTNKMFIVTYKCEFKEDEINNKRIILNQTFNSYIIVIIFNFQRKKTNIWMQCWFITITVHVDNRNKYRFNSSCQLFDNIVWKKE